MRERSHILCGRVLRLAAAALLMTLAAGCELAGSYKGDDATVEFNTGGLTNRSQSSSSR